MSYTWYKIFNYDEFVDEGLVSKKYTLDLENIGEKEILVTQGNTVNILYEGVLLCSYLNDRNPFYFEGYGIYKNSAGDVFLGVEDDES